MTSAQIVPVVATSLVAWRIYARVRRNIGRQRLRKGRLTTSIVIVGLLTLALGVAALSHLQSLIGLGGGLLLGVPVALVGLRLTRFETTAEGEFYTPNTYLGLTLTLLIIGRMTYRFLVLFANPPRGAATPTLFQSPLTLFLFGLTAGYYLAYHVGLLRHTHPTATATQG
jgi:hypothetical protein